MNREFNILAVTSMAACALWLVAPAAAAPITSSMGLQNAVPTSVESVQYRRYGYRGGYYRGYGYRYYGYGGYYPYGYGYAPGYYQPYYGPASPRYYVPYQRCTPEMAGRADAGC